MEREDGAYDATGRMCVGRDRGSRIYGKVHIDKNGEGGRHH